MGEIDAYVNDAVSRGVKREDVLADFLKSGNPELEAYAGKVPEKTPDAPPSVDHSFTGMAKEMVKGNEIPVAAGLGAAAAVGVGGLAYKAGQRNAVAPPSSHQAAMEEAALRRANANAGIAEANLQKLTAVKPSAAQGFMGQPVGQTNLTLEAAASRKMPLPTALDIATPTPIEKLAGTTAATINTVDPELIKPVPPAPPPIPEIPATPVAKVDAMLGKDALSAAPEITGQAGAAAQPPKVKNVLEFPNVPEPVIPPAGKVRRSPTEVLLAEPEEKLNAAQRQLATAVGGPKVPETEWRSFQDEVYGKNPPKSGAKGGGVPEWDSVVKTAKDNPKKYPAIVSAIENIEKKYPKQSGKANIGMLLGLAGNLLGGLGIAKALKEGDTASAGLGAIDQLLANASMLAGKQGALGAIGTAASKLSPFMMGMTPTAVSSGTLNSPEAQALFKKARPTGAVPPPR